MYNIVAVAMTTSGTHLQFLDTLLLMLQLLPLEMVVVVVAVVVLLNKEELYIGITEG